MSRINDNLAKRGDLVVCTHCNTTLATAGEETLQRALLRTGPLSDLGPGVRAGAPTFIPEKVELRQYLCPGCATALLTEVVACKDSGTRVSSLDRRGERK